MLQELLDKYSNNFTIVFDIKNIGATKIRVPLFNAAWAADHGQVTISTTIKDIKYKDICFQLTQNITKFGLVTFELLSGQPEKFKQDLLGEIYSESESGIPGTPTKVYIPVTPLPVLATEDKFRYSGMEFFSHNHQLRIDIPGDCTVRISLYPVAMTADEKEWVEKGIQEKTTTNNLVTNEKGQFQASAFAVPCDTDTYAIVNIIAAEMNWSFEKALTALTEIGLLNMLAYPDLHPKSTSNVHDILSEEKWGPILEKIKGVWHA